MKSAVYYGKHDLRVEESPMPQVREKDVLIEIMACGVCGTDVHIYEGDKGAAEEIGHASHNLVHAARSAGTGAKGIILQHFLYSFAPGKGVYGLLESCGGHFPKGVGRNLGQIRSGHKAGCPIGRGEELEKGPEKVVAVAAGAVGGVAGIV